jgi:hypothetical protein
MVAPTISGATLLRTTTGSSGCSIVGTGASYSTVTTNALYLRFTGVAFTANQENYIQINLDSTFDLTGRGIFVWLRNNFNMTGASTNRFALVSASGFRAWDCRHSSNADVEFYLDVEGNSFTDTGTFDITAVTSMRYYWNSTNNNSSRGVDISRPYSFLKTTGVIIGEGEIGNPVTPASIASLLRGLILGSTSAIPSLGGNYLEFPIPITLAPVVASFSNGALIFSAISYPTSFTSSATPRTAITSRVFNVDTDHVCTFSGFQLNGTTGQEFTFNEISSVSNTYTSDFLVLRHAAVNLGSANWYGTLSGGTGTITGGAIMSGTVRANTASQCLNWNGSTLYENLDLTGTSNAHYFNFDGANFTDGATVDVSTVTFGTPGTKLFRLNAAGKTLNIAVAAGSGITASDVTIVAGTVNVTAPALSVSVFAVDIEQNPIPGAAVYLETSPGALVVLNGVTNSSGVITTSYSGSTPQAVVGWVRSGSGPIAYVDFPLGGNITSAGYNQTAILQEE